MVIIDTSHHEYRDTAGRVTSITRTGTAGTLSAGYAYNVDNSVATVTYGNGAYSEHAYYDNGRIQGRIRRIKATGRRTTRGLTMAR
jgi:hypothetical protein